MSARVAVVGWGAAGLAAARAASSRGARVTLIGSGAGATSFYTGAVDDVDWSERESAQALLGQPLLAGALDEEVAAYASALTEWILPPAGDPLPRLATVNGVVRSARGRDRALLDLASLAGRRVLAPRVPRAGWDADALVSSLRDEAELGVTYEAIDAVVLRFADESRIADADLASRYDEDTRLDWLAARLAPFVEATGRAKAAVLLGPWLGASASRAARLEALLGCPVGEALSTTSLVPGLRLEAARDAWLQRSGLAVSRGRATRIDASSDGATSAAALTITVEGAEPVVADAVVLAAGGLLGGGLVYDPPEHGSAPDGPERTRPPFRLSFGAPGVRVATGAVFGVASSVFGPVLDAAWPAPGAPGILERVGVVTDEHGACASRLFAAGDLVAGARRTILQAVLSGARAGIRAAAVLDQPVPRTVLSA
jgi:glycerol-3-phosphate dehydrogenase subunit B